ncbi:MAG: cytochrome c3 family protein [Geothermobacteraceae bacterium]
MAIWCGHNRPRPRGRTWLVLVFLLLGLSGCDPVTRHKLLSTLFDGVPELPPADSYCADYLERVKNQAAAGAEATESSGEPVKRSVHQPFAEKRCPDCHDFEKSIGLVLPAEKLCFSCHDNLLTGSQLHGPAAVGGCLGCHLPHDSKYDHLLAASPAELCGKCHVEKRLAAGMHDRLAERGLVCAECHDPHGGERRYFLR